MRAAAPLVLSVFSTFAIGGPQVRFAKLANAFGGAFRHAIVSMDGARQCAERLDPLLDVTWPEIALRKGSTFGNVLAIRAALRRLRPDLLVTYNWGAIEWAMANSLAGFPHLHVEDGFGPEERDTQIPRRVLTRRLVLRRCKTLLPSRTLWRIATEVWRLPEARLRYVPNGIDTERFSPRAAAREAGPPVIGTVATLRAEKNLVRLLQAFAALPADAGARLMIVGDGPERSRLEAEAGRLGLGGRVVFPGAANDPAPRYADFDIFALTSDTEQMPISVLEAMSCGLPCVATDVGDVRAMLAAENAPYVVPCDAQAVSGGLAGLLGDGRLRAGIGAANRDKALRDYDERTMLDAWRALFPGAAPLNASRPAPPAA